MKAGKYKLQTVLDVRERAQQEASKVVALRRADLAAAEAEMRRRIDAVELCRQQQQAAQTILQQKLTQGTEVRTINLHRTHLADLRRSEDELRAEAEKQRAVVARAEQAVEQALVHLVEAAKELRVIEKHRDGWQQEQRRAGERREQKAGDEIGTIIHRRLTQKY